MAEAQNAWTLISVLFSSIRLDPGLAATLHDAALELYRRDASVQQVAGDILSGRVVNLKKRFSWVRSRVPRSRRRSRRRAGAGRSGIS
jgi:hypothetical protein